MALMESSLHALDSLNAAIPSHIMEKIGDCMSEMRKRCCDSRKTKKGRKYYGCEDNPECDFMSWQKPSAKKCPNCGGYMVEKGNKLVCADEQPAVM